MDSQQRHPASDCRDKALPGSITYQFNDGGMDRVRVSVAILSSTTEMRNMVNITIKPYIDVDCAPAPTPTNLSDKEFSKMDNGMDHVEIEYDVGLLPQLGCSLAKSVQIEFLAPDGSEVQIMSVKLIGDGFINHLQELGGPDEQPPTEDDSILDSELVVYILIGVGALFLLVMLALVWVCCGRPCCCKKQDTQV